MNIRPFRRTIYREGGMRWIPVAVIAMLLCLGLSACLPGTENQPCLKDGSCSSADLACSAGRNQCIKCGDTGNPCCPNNSCNTEFSACINGTCEACGWDSLTCCPGDKCQNPKESVCISGSCERCGNTGEPACSGNPCKLADLIVYDGKCTACGSNGVPPCADGSCKFESTYIKDGICVSCGNTGEPCCPDNQCVNTYICGGDQVCHNDCGGFNPGQPCCAGKICGKGYICGAENTCMICGYRGLPACSSDKCEGWLVSSNAVCKAPFEIDPGTDIAACLSARPGKNESERDFCYWYAAYFKKAPGLCEKIEWVEMAGLCRRGENPGNYFTHTSYQ